MEITNRVMWLILAALMLTSTTLRAQQETSSPFNNHRLEIADTLEDCVNRLSENNANSQPGINGNSIRLVSWNIKKGLNPAWLTDLGRYARSANLITLQEALLPEQTSANLGNRYYWSFAAGYRRGSEYTGVTTYSKGQPLFQCNFKVKEPWLRTPKATTITQYALAGGAQKLLVINLHAINYTFGLAVFRRQFEPVENVLSLHDGPVLLTGDFNTWSKKREGLVNTIAQRHSLKLVSYPDDNRVKFFGHVVDHIFYRHLTLIESRSPRTSSSDHTPVFAEFSL